ncbi:MAG: 6-pyruvoyl tetrahydropterin synthase family protein [Candidatus Thermoplasmatota archaeon]|nr:6-pyruvoyl tetrahydropterin synthase family protein [Candidatus Thermoplasmatota archaeon]
MNSIRLELDGWEKSITFSACHILPGHEKCGRMHGHNYAIHLRIEGEPKGKGVVYDFVPIKTKLKEIAERFDHGVLIPAGSENVNIKEDEVLFEIEEDRYIFPKTDSIIMDLERTTAEYLAKYILEKIIEEMRFPDNIKAVEIGVDESRGQGAWARRELDE